jgi:hypothetical protein
MHNSKRIQQVMVWYICTQLGEERLSERADGRRVSGLKHIMEEARRKYYPVSRRHLYRWIDHYIKFGEVLAETKAWEKKEEKRLKRLGIYQEEMAETAEWTVEDTQYLQHIVDSMPSLYLDEI